MSRLFKSSISPSLAVLLGTASYAAAQAPTELPAIIIAPKVQGATLERAPVAKPAEPAPAPVPAARPPAAKKAAAATAATSAPTEAAPAASATAGDSDTVAGVPANTIGTQVTIVTGEDLRRQQVRHVSDALRALPGVQISSNGSPGSLTQVRIRGAEGRHTRVLIDGIEANTTKDGEFDFSNLLAEDIERIEIIRGPMSGLYGSGALGGVVNIITRTAKGPPSLTLRTEIGSFGTKDIAARLAAGGDNGYISLSTQWRESSGFNISPFGQEKDENRIANFALRAGVRLAPSAQLDVTLRHSEKRLQYDDFGAVERKPFLTADDANNKLHDQNTLMGATLKWDSLGGALTQELKSNYVTTTSINRFEPTQGFNAGVVNNTRDDGTRLNGGYSATYRFDTPAIGLKQSLTGLVEANRETYKPLSDFGFSDGDGKTRARGQTSAAAEWRGTFADRLTVTAGARHDNNDTFQNFTTWRSSLSYAWREAGLRPHASIGTGVKLPGMYDQFGPNSQDYKSNPNLKPETSRGWDAGIEASFMGGRAILDVTYFSQNLRDKLKGFGGSDDTDFRSFTTNVKGESTREGVEVSGRYALSPSISLGAAYTYTDARDAEEKPEIRRAPHSGRADVKSTFAEGRGTATLAVSYNGTTRDTAFNVNYDRSLVQLPHYWLVSASVAYKIQPNIEVFGRVENALNTKYQEVYGYQTPGIAVYGGVKVTFDELLKAGQK